MNKKHFYSAVILLLFLAIGIQPSLAVYIIPGDDSIGEWDSVNRIYTLTTNVSGSIQIDESNLTLNGNGWTVTGTGLGTGIEIISKTGVTIQNLEITGFHDGISIAKETNSIPSSDITVEGCNIHSNANTGITIQYSNNNTLTNNEISNNTGIGIFITSYSDYNTVTGNTVSGNGNGIKIQLNSNNNSLTNNTVSNNGNNGIELYSSNDYSLTGNTVSNNYVGIWLQGCSATDPNVNTITNNTVSNNAGGIYLKSSSENEIYNNNFIWGDNTLWQAYDSPGDPSNVFDLNGGGNYWSNWTGPDADGDGIVDLPYGFTGGQDNYPWAIQNGWLEPEVLIVQLVDKVADMNLQQGIDNSLDAKLDAALNALDDINQNNDVAAINSLNAFINAVEAQRDQKITSAQADELIANANYIISLLNG